jgi:hypothetical protein
MDSKPYDVVLLPDTVLNEKCITVSNSLQSNDTLFTLNNTDYYSHLSLYMLQLDSARLQKTIKILELLSKDIKPVNLKPKTFHMVIEASVHNSFPT